MSEGITVTYDQNGGVTQIGGKACREVESDEELGLKALVEVHGGEIEIIAPGILKLGAESCYIYINGKRIWICG